MNIDNFEASLGATEGGETHPNGALRADFIEFGKQVAQELIADGIEPTYSNCLARLNQHIEEKSGLIAEYRQRFAPNASAQTQGEVKNATMADVEWAEKQARISTGTEQEHWIKQAKWYRDHLKS